MLVLCRRSDKGQPRSPPNTRNHLKALIVQQILLLLHADVYHCCVLLQAFDSPGFPYLASLGVGEQLTFRGQVVACTRADRSLSAHEGPLTLLLLHCN
jgi:hypothetical protein